MNHSLQSLLLTFMHLHLYFTITSDINKSSRKLLSGQGYPDYGSGGSGGSGSCNGGDEDEEEEEVLEDERDETESGLIKTRDYSGGSNRSRNGHTRRLSGSSYSNRFLGNNNNNGDGVTINNGGISGTGADQGLELAPMMMQQKAGRSASVER